MRAAVGVARASPHGVDAVTLFAGEGPRGIVDQLSRDPESLAGRSPPACGRCSTRSWRWSSTPCSSCRPSTARVFRDAGWDASTAARPSCSSCCQLPGAEIVRGAGGIAEGFPEAFADATLPKFRDGGLLLVHAGGGAGLFSLDHRRLGQRRHRQSTPVTEGDQSAWL